MQLHLYLQKVNNFGATNHATHFPLTSNYRNFLGGPVGKRIQITSSQELFKANSRNPQARGTPSHPYYSYITPIPESLEVWEWYGKRTWEGGPTSEGPWKNP